MSPYPNGSGVVPRPDAGKGANDDTLEKHLRLFRKRIVQATAEDTAGGITLYIPIKDKRLGNGRVTFEELVR